MSQVVYTFPYYCELAQVTSNKSLSVDERWRVVLAGLVGELGEVMDIIKKIIGHGHPVNKEKLADECGDVFWYIAEAATLLNMRLELRDGVVLSHRDAFVQAWRVTRRVVMFGDGFACTSTTTGTAISTMSHEWLETVFGEFVNLVATLELDIQDVLHRNVEKLRKRYPEGFNNEASLNRVV